MKEKIPSFNLIYRLTCSNIWLQNNEGKLSITHAPVLSNLKTISWSNVSLHCTVHFFFKKPPLPPTKYEIRHFVVCQNGTYIHSLAPIKTIIHQWTSPTKLLLPCFFFNFRPVECIWALYPHLCLFTHVHIFPVQPLTCKRVDV